jgi:hypothetical protein
MRTAKLHYCFSRSLEDPQMPALRLVLVTPDSVDQRWLNFEAGIGIGCGIPVMPLLLRGFTKNDFRPPLNQLQARNLANRADFDGMIKDFREMFSCSWSEERANSLFADLQKTCMDLDAAKA